MKKIVFLWLALLISAAAQAADYPGIDLLNSTNWVKWFDQTLGYRYDSHGCLHFSPSDIYLLAKTIPPGIPLTVKKYRLKADDPAYDLAAVPYLADKTGSPADIQKHASMFNNYSTGLIFYPSFDLLVILVNDYPYAKVKALAGPPEDFLMAYDVQKGKPVQWDFMLTTPTDPGQYQVLRVTDHYLSSAYYKNTIVPFGAWIEKVKGTWSYQKNGKWFKLPDNVAADLARSAENRLYNYYDINYNAQREITAARYAGHDFGKYVLLWTTDGKNHYPEMGYAAGELVFEQIVLVKDLVHLLTSPGPDDLDSVVSLNQNFKYYRELSQPGKKAELLAPLLADPRVAKAVKEYQENRLPRDQRARWEAFGLYNYFRVNSLVIDKQAGWYQQVKKDWALFSDLRAKLRADFDQLGILSLANRQNIVEGWLTDRLEFRKVTPPKQAKNLGDLSFSAFFKPDDESRLFSERERAIMVSKLKTGGGGLNLNIVDTLNGYNFGVLLNDILGDLYKSHGCMHVSPRNIHFLSQLLPIGAQMKVYPYSERISPEALGSIPYLADLINYAEDLEKLKPKFAVTAEVQVAVYPTSGDWVIFLQKQPFARLTVKGGPQTKYYLLQDRDSKGLPIFEPTLAYPTTPGNYWVFRKLDNYLSNLYRDQTLVPQGGMLLWAKEKKKWTFKDEKGNWKELPPALRLDLEFPPEKRVYTYYNPVRDSSGEVVSLRWGSNPFGRYPILISNDRRTPWPELVHTSGDLMMEERQLVNDLIRILTAPHDQLDECLPFSENFGLYRACAEFVASPDRTDLIQPKERAAYRLYLGLNLTASEEALLPKDVVVAAKVVRKLPLNAVEQELLVREGIAYRRSGNLKLNQEKILGLHFDTYQYVVTIQKYAHHYETLKKRWPELTGLRRALLKDFNAFVIKDQQLFQNFMRELMLKRNNLEKLTQENALQILNGMLGE